jgi:hypothetical protein
MEIDFFTLLLNNGVAIAMVTYFIIKGEKTQTNLAEAVNNNTRVLEKFCYQQEKK